VLGPARLFRRQLLADRGAALTVAVVVLVVAALLAAWARAIDHIFADEVREQITQAGPRERDVTGQVEVYPPQLSSTSMPGAEGRIYGRFEQTLRGIRADASDRVRSVLGEAYYQLLGQDGELLGHVPEAYNLGVRLTLAADPQYSDHIQVTRGEGSPALRCRWRSGWRRWRCCPSSPNPARCAPSGPTWAGGDGRWTGWWSPPPRSRWRPAGGYVSEPSYRSGRNYD
jgi:hypothetical protein